MLCMPCLCVYAFCLLLARVTVRAGLRGQPAARQMRAPHAVNPAFWTLVSVRGERGARAGALRAPAPRRHPARVCWVMISHDIPPALGLRVMPVCPFFEHACACGGSAPAWGASAASPLFCVNSRCRGVHWWYLPLRFVSGRVEQCGGTDVSCWC